MATAKLSTSPDFAFSGHHPLTTASVFRNHQSCNRELEHNNNYEFLFFCSWSQSKIAQPVFPFWLVHSSTLVLVFLIWTLIHHWTINRRTRFSTNSNKACRWYRTQPWTLAGKATGCKEILWFVKFKFFMPYTFGPHTHSMQTKL